MYQKNIKLLNHRYIIAVFALLFAVQLEAQINVSGTIKDEDGLGLIGATVIVKSDKSGTVTDIDGNFDITVPSSGDTLAISYTGYEYLELAVGSQTTFDIVMKTANTTLDEVIVVGYGTQRAQDVTGSITKVDSEMLERTNNTTFEQALGSRVAGLNSTVADGTPGSGIRIRIRGGTSINANNEPLYVIDGVPVEVDYSVSDGPSAIESTSSSPLANIDPGNIASVEVLKDASAAAIYGSRGANGVILITTKSGKAGKSTISFETNNTYSFVPESRHIDMMNTSEWGQYQINRLLYRNGVIDTTVMFSGLTPEQEQMRYDSLPNTNWQGEFYRPGFIQSHALQTSGGNDKNLFSIRGSYLKNAGAIRNSSFERFNLNINLQNQITDRFKIKTVIMPSYSLKSGPLTGGGFNQRNMGSVLRTLTRRPDRGVGVFDDDDEDSGVWVDPVTEALRTKVSSNTVDMIGNMLMTYEIFNGLYAQVRLGTNISDGKTKNYFPKDFGRGFQNGGVGLRYHYQNISWNNQNMLTYKTSFGSKKMRQRINAVAAFTQQYRNSETEQIINNGFDVETLGFYGLQMGILPNVPQTFTTETVIKSYLGRVNYNLNNRYNLTLSMRADGSSRFGGNNKWGYFPAAAVSWNANNEKFLSHIDDLSNLKFRLSYGQTGNQGIPAYGSFALMGLTNYVLNSTAVPGLSVTELPNPDLKWEFTDQYDFGFDVGLWEEKVSLSFDVYYKRTKDLLLRVPIPISTGFSQRLTNIGSVENRGVEFALNTTNIDTKKLLWETEFTFSFNRNKVLDLGGTEEQLFADQFTNGKFTNIMRVGESLGNWYGYETTGVYSYDDFEGDNMTPISGTNYGVPSWVSSNEVPKLGDMKYVDQNGDGLITPDDRTIIARTQPKHYGGMYNRLNYGSFDLGIFLTYKYGFDVVRGNLHRMLSSTAGFTFNRPGEMNDAWTPENPNASQPRPDYSDPEFTDRYVEDGSFLRLQSINMGYTLPAGKLKNVGISSLRIFTNIDNLAVWTKYNGYDPEVSVARGQRAILSANLDYGAYPRTMNIAFGLRVGL